MTKDANWHPIYVQVRASLLNHPWIKFQYIKALINFVRLHLTTYPNSRRCALLTDRVSIPYPIDKATPSDHSEGVLIILSFSSIHFISRPYIILVKHFSLVLSGVFRLFCWAFFVLLRNNEALTCHKYSHI